MFQVTSNTHPDFDKIYLTQDEAEGEHGRIVPISVLSESGYGMWKKDQPEPVSAWLGANTFKAKAGDVLLLPANDGSLARVLLGVGKGPASLPYITGALPPALPGGVYRFDEPGELPPELAALGWAAGHYQFSLYKSNGTAKSPPRLVMPDGVDAAALRSLIEGVFMVRDLVNMPANDMGPDALERAAKQLADQHRGTFSAVRGDDLLDQNFPLVHAVGRAADQAPRLIDLRFERTGAPKVTLVGKGVCFDTGGLNLKPDSAMSLMKKDMGGAAHVLGLAHMILCAGLAISLRVIVPAVENSVSGSSFRPGDVYSSRKKLTVEIGNTDAEGRLILADALALADEDNPDLIIDMATLTGAARTALGPDLPPFYTASRDLADALARHADAKVDPVWRLPLWPGYDDWLDSAIASTNHIANLPFAGSVIAALFLKKFISDPERWLHFDVYAWTPKAKPGQPVGGEAQGLRALLVLLEETYGTAPK